MLNLGWMSEETFETLIPILQKQGYSLFRKEKNRNGHVRVQMRLELAPETSSDVLVRLFDSFNPKNH